MAIEVTVDRDNVNDEFVIVRKLHKHHGQAVRADEVVLDVETSKTVTEIRSPEDGTLSMSLTEGDEVAVGAVLFRVSREGASPSETREPPASHPAETSGDAPAEPRASRAAAELAARLGVPLRGVPSRGWITSADVRAAANPASASSPPARPAAASRPSPRPAAAEDGVVPKVAFRSERISLRKRTEARNLQAANSHGNTSTIGAELALPGPRLVAPPFLFEDGISDLVIFEAARLLRQFPDLNAFHLDERTVGFFEEVNFGISFDSGRNLKVLTLRNADRLSLAEIQAEFERLLQLYESEAPLEDALLHSSTVTLTDLSRSEADFMLPLLNARQSLILGITRRDSNRYALYASFDHRVSEGLQVARFLGELRARLQSHCRDSAAASTRLRCSVCDQTMEAELKMGGRGLLRIVQPDGSDGYLCRNCFQGW